jgi:ABC-type branched-subunit amino acid transport system substrate-binding protein
MSRTSQGRTGHGRVGKAFATLAALALVVAACGDDDDDDAEEPSTATTEAVTATTEATPATTAAVTEETSAPATEETSAPATEAPETTAASAVAPEDIATDVGVDDTTIKVGMLADLSGAFAPLVTQIVAAQEVFWDKVNDEGGIAGRQVELIVEDHGYDVAVMQEKFEGMRDEVAIISQSTGSPHTAAIAAGLVEEELIAIPLSWYSGWAFGETGQNALESYTNYCLESMNGIEYLAGEMGIETVAIISFPGEYGGDGAAGAAKAAEALGLEVVFDGTGLVTPPSADNPSPDQTAIISQIVQTNPDLVWAVINPTQLAVIMGGAVAQGYTGQWSGNSPTYNYQYLQSDLADALDQYYTASTYVVTWGADVPGMQEMVDAMTAARPDLPVSDTYIVGWTEGMITKAVLEQAAANGDMTRAGIAAAASEVTVDFEGLAPTQTWGGDPNDFVVRESYIYDVDLSKFNYITLGEGIGSTGNTLLTGPYTGELAADYDFTEPCFVAG